MLLALHRIIRRWNQTGQKYAGAPDIVHSALFRGPISVVLWCLVGSTYMDIMVRLSRHIARSISSPDDSKAGGEEQTDFNGLLATLAVIPLVATAFVFKLAFTARDAPELTAGINQGLVEWVGGLSLVSVAQMVFAGVALVAVWQVFSEWTRAKVRTKGKGNGGTFSLYILWMMGSY